jgi:hypothetical protein
VAPQVHKGEDGEDSAVTSSFYRRGLPPRDAFQKVRVTVAANGTPGGAAPVAAAAALAMRPQPPSGEQPGAPSASDLAGLERGTHAEGWRLLLGPGLFREPVWVQASEAQPYVADLVRAFGAERVLAVAWENAGATGAAHGVLCVVKGMGACWELTRPLGRSQGKANPAAPLKEALSVGGRVQVNFAGVWVGATVVVFGEGKGVVDVDGGGVVADVPQSAFRHVPADGGVVAMTDDDFKRSFAGISVVVVDAPPPPQKLPPALTLAPKRMNLDGSRFVPASAADKPQPMAVKKMGGLLIKAHKAGTLDTIAKTMG